MRTFLTICLAACLLLSGCVYARPPILQEGPAQTLLTEQTTASETTATTQTEPASEIREPEEWELVRVEDYIPDAVVELKYATTDNFTGQVIYQFYDAWLRYGTVKKLMAVQETLKSQGYGLKIWDAFRPVYGQQALWDAFPDPDYVSNPATGSSSHCRGNTVDITLVGADGRELEMPTNFDDFTALADRDYSDCTSQAAANAKLLEDAMYANGFRGYRKEWWHFTDLTDYDIEKVFDPAQ